MTTMDYTNTLSALRRLKVQTGSLACLGCDMSTTAGSKGARLFETPWSIWRRLTRWLPTLPA